MLEGSHTNTMCRGTFDYMAPELFGSYETEDSAASGEYRPEVTCAVDIYSFGCVLREIVTGERMQRSHAALRDPWCEPGTSHSLRIFPVIAQRPCDSS